MTDKNTQDEAYQQLLNTRSLLEDLREANGASSESLNEPQVELEERAQQEKMQQQLQHEERINRDQLYAVNMALQRIQAGTFGLCRECGEEIAPARLRAVPWAAKCIHCASEAEGAAPAQPRQATESVPPLAEEYQGVADEELRQGILMRLRHDGRVALDELGVGCQGQKVIFSGALPSQEQREILYEIVEDILGLHEIEDNISIARLAWQRKDRAPGREVPENSPVEILLEGRPQDSDAFTAVKEGEVMEPGDRMVFDERG
jgi:DnaK suppressor protein